MNALITIAVIGGTFWYFLRQAQIAQQQQPKAVVSIGPFNFTVPTSIYINETIQRIKTKTTVTSTDRGILLTFPSVPIPVPFSLGVMELPLKSKLITWDKIGTTLDDYQTKNLIKGIAKGLMGIKSEADLTQTKIFIPQMKIPIY